MDHELYSREELTVMAEQARGTYNAMARIWSRGNRWEAALCGGGSMWFVVLLTVFNTILALYSGINYIWFASGFSCAALAWVILARFVSRQHMRTE